MIYRKRNTTKERTDDMETECKKPEKGSKYPTGWKAPLIVILFIAFLFTGCAILNEYIATDTGALVVKKAGRMAGIVAGFEKPEDVEKMINYCNEMLKEKDESLKQMAMKTAYKYIYKRYGKNQKTVIIMAEISDLVGVIIDGDTLSFMDGWDITGTDMFITAFRDGLILTK